MKKQSKAFNINLVMFPFDILVCPAMDIDEIRHALKKVGYSPEEIEQETPIVTDPLGSTYLLPGGAVLIIINQIDTNVIAHEALHATNYICHQASIPFTQDTEEVWAYLLGYITEQITSRVL